MSEGVDDKKDIRAILLAHFPTAIDVERAKTSDDRSGTDYWVSIQSGQKLSVDVKVRKDDWAKRHPEQDDIALEVWSVIDVKIGWTRDTAKRTDYILWIWLETGRWMLVPFPMLCSVFEKYWEQWCRVYRAPIQTTRNPNGSQWKSQCVFVPRNVVWNAMYGAFGGSPNAPRQVNTQASLAEGIARAKAKYYQPPPSS